MTTAVKVSEFSKETTETTTQYIGFQANELLGLVFKNACINLLLRNGIEHGSKTGDDITMEIARVLSGHPDWDEFDKICRGHKFSIESSTLFRIDVEKAMNHTIELRLSLNKLDKLYRDQWFDAIEAEGPEMLKNADKIIEIISGKQG